MTYAGFQQAILDPESTTVRTATDLLLAHTPGTDGDSGERCPRCDTTHPCPAAVRARQVRYAAGLFDDPADPDPAPSTAVGTAAVPPQTASDRRARSATNARQVRPRKPRTEQAPAEEAAATS